MRITMMAKSAYMTLNAIRRAIHRPKHDLISLQNELEKTNTKKAEALGRVIADLEAWQNTD